MLNEKTTADILLELPKEEADTIREHIIEMEQGRRTIAQLQDVIKQKNNRIKALQGIVVAFRQLHDEVTEAVQEAAEAGCD